MILAASRIVRRFLLSLVHGYQRYLSWLLGGQCRFVPSCSCYAEEALSTQPLWRALWLITWRIARCQPFCKGGIDPVPHREGEERHHLNPQRALATPESTDSTR